MTEANLRSTVKRAFKKMSEFRFVAWQRHEDAYSSGIPDLSYTMEGVSGWVELKALPCWPKRQDSLIRGKLTDTLNNRIRFRRQLDWMEDRYKAGCKALFVLIQIDREYLLFDLHTANKVYNGLNGDQMRASALLHCKGSLTPALLAECLCDNIKRLPDAS